MPVASWLEGYDRAEGAGGSRIETLGALLDRIPGGLVLLDGEHRVVFANAAGREALGVLAREAGGVVTHIAGRPIGELMAALSSLTHEIHTDSRIYEVSLKPTDKGETFLYMRDVSEEREFGRRMHMYEQLDAVGRLASGVAHDFNNIFTVINGYAEMLLELDLPEEARGQIATIHQSGIRAAELINQMLDFSRRTQVELRHLDLVSFMRDFTELTERTLPENIHISFDYALGEYTARADPEKLRQALTNLALVAHEAMPGGGDLLLGLSRIAVRQGEKPPVPEMPAGEWIVISTADTGRGMSPEDLRRAFEPFFSPRGAPKSAGLALSQTYGIIKLHGGYIDVRAEPGKGSAFRIFLPPARGAVTAGVQEEPPAEYLKEAGHAILVVEDEKAVLDFIRRVLAGLGYRVLPAENGREALAIYNANADDIGLVVTDLVMPGMSGIELLRSLRALRPDLKVIALSGYPTMDEKEIIKAGFERFVRKPFQVRTLAEAIQRTIERKSGHKAHAS